MTSMNDVEMIFLNVLRIKNISFLKSYKLTHLKAFKNI